MANVLSSFLVGVGFDYDQKGANEIGSGIDGIKSKALQLGSVVAGAFGIKALTADFAASRDELGKFSKTFGVIPSDVFALGKALEHEGGSVDAFMGQLSSLERMRAGILDGDADFIAQAGRAGITDTSIITDAENATQAYIALADVFKGLSGQQRLNAADALGFDEASIRLLSQGSDAVSAAMTRQKAMRDVTEEMTKMSAEFNDQMQDLFDNTGGFADNISTKLLPEINKIIGATNNWISANRELIDQKMDVVLDPIAKNFNTIAAAGGLLATGGLLAGLAGMAKYVPIIGKGISVAAGAAARLTAVGAGITIGAELWDWDAEDLKENLGIDAPDWLFKPMDELFKDDGDMSPRDPNYVPGSHYDPSDLPQPESDFPDLPMFGSNMTNNTTTQRSQITVNSVLDGNVLSSFVVNVVDGQAELAYQDLKSTVVS